MDKLKLKWWIFAYLLGFSTLLLIILWLFQTVFLYDMYKYSRRIEIQRAVSYVRENINNQDLYSLFDELQREKEILVMPTNQFTPPKNHAPVDRRRRREETITQTEEFVLNDGRTLSLTFHAIITPVDATVTTLQLQLYIITSVMIMLSILLAVLIAKRISRPIEEINRSAKALARGKYDTAFAGKGFLEIKELSDTLNTAAHELSKVDNLRRELMANVSHDLRTPLSLIYSYAEMMHDFPDEITPGQTQVIMDETKRLNLLVNDILDLSKLEGCIHRINRYEFNLTAAIRETTQRMAELLKHEDYDISFEYDRELIVYADEVKIIQAFYNLLTNAINYCGENKLVVVKQIEKNQFVKIEVIDYGDGISHEDLPYIWDRYYKVDKNHKRAVVGTGLGLSIVKRIFELHNIEYGVESEKGKGSVFWFRLEYFKYMPDKNR
ncbi:MAG: HAMP domain-containing histidine kinase [Clostridiaceae bacterium]|nr:HAMP domain-containing histidine kinase [Clostridiaceae bacterium]